MFHKILVANRGEIAVRVIRTCREMGIPTVAVFSDVDRPCPHVKLADEAYPLGGNSSAETYLNIPKLTEAARRSGAEAVHPGYGFLSENPRYAEAVEEAGMVFIGPSPGNLGLAGDKAAMRRAMASAGVPIVPGTEHPSAEEEKLASAAARVGYPLMIKAAAGGGGKGIRLVERPDDLRPSLRRAMSEAQSAFGRQEVYLERYLMEARHVEIQLLGDRHGEVVHLGERECSIQRRHQKLVEESPSPFVTEDLRKKLCRAAVSGAKAIGYRNAGTMEFLVLPDRSFYFIEINARLQVEHPVTECLSGLDLVREQIRLAAGEPLGSVEPPRQSGGHAIECRIYAEDPDSQFMPCPGRITEWTPPGGRGVRVESAAFTGWDVPVYYDPLLAKLIVWGASRQESLARLHAALREFRVGGIRTTLPFFQALLEEKAFREGEFTTLFVDRWVRNLARRASDASVDQAAAIAVALARVERDRGIGAATPVSGGRQSQGLSAWQKALRSPLP